jgi:hypothetical protein
MNIARTILLSIVLLAVASATFAVSAQETLLGELYGKGRLAAAEVLCDSLLIADPGNALLNQFKGRLLADQYRGMEAAPYLERAVAADTARTWIYAWSQVYLGIVHYAAGDDEAAGRAWTAACDVRATKNSTAMAKLYLDCLVEDKPFEAWTVRDTEHFEFRISPRLENVDVESFTGQREAAFASIAAWFGREPDRKIRFYVWSSNEEASQAGLPNLGFSRPHVSLIHSLANQTRGHEMTHVISGHAIPPRNVAPLIMEGAAIYHDQRSSDRFAAAAQAWSTLPADHRPDLHDLWEDGGREKFLELYRDQTPDAARRIYGADFDGWLADFGLRLEARE